MCTGERASCLQKGFACTFRLVWPRPPDQTIEVHIDVVVNRHHGYDCALIRTEEFTPIAIDDQTSITPFGRVAPDGESRNSFELIGLE
jgi:hypothetical protein